MKNQWFIVMVEREHISPNGIFQMSHNQKKNRLGCISNATAVEYVKHVLPVKECTI